MVLESVDKMWDDDIEKPAGTFFWSKHLQKRPVRNEQFLRSITEHENKNETEYEIEN